MRSRAMHRRLALATLAGAVTAACGPGLKQVGQGQTEDGGSLRVQPVVPNTDLAVGRNRFALGVLQITKGPPGAIPLPDAEVQLRFFHPIEPRPALKAEAKAQFQYVSDKAKGLYIAQVQFDQPGIWGVEVSGSAAGKTLQPAGVQFQVRQTSQTPALGAPAPRSRNLTRYDVDDIKKIDSGLRPNDMHELSIAAAIEQHKPLVVVFASPGFCVTQTCAPQVDEVQKLKSKYGDRANFIHIEIFKDPMTRTPYETVVEWGLVSEPWVFMVDRNGIVAEKFEGPAPVTELEPALVKLL